MSPQSPTATSGCDPDSGDCSSFMTGDLVRWGLNDSLGYYIPPPDITRPVQNLLSDDDDPLLTMSNDSFGINIDLLAIDSTNSVNLSSLDNATGAGNETMAHEMVQLSAGAEATLIVFYTLTILFSVVGNMLVVVVFTRGRRCRTDIRPFLVNLAAADLIMALFCMPFTFTYVMTRTWIFSEPMCPLVLFMQHLSVSASVFTNMAIGIDRFLVVTFPLKARMTTRRARYILAVIWVCAVGLSSVQLVVGRASSHGDVVSCEETWKSPEARRIFTMFILFITYIIPLVILSVTYSIVARLLWNRTTPGNAHESRDLQQLKAKRKVIKMLILVVIMFGLCWLPLHTFFLVYDFSPEVFGHNPKLPTVIFYIAFLLAMSNSCANPIIYGFTNDSFRIDLATLFSLWFPFCVCLKRLANRKWSMSTCDSQYNRRFSTVRHNKASGGVVSIYRQPGTAGRGWRTAAMAVRNGELSTAHRNGGKGTYIELRRELLARERSAVSMNDFYRDSLDRRLVTNVNKFSSNGSLGHTYNNHHAPLKRTHDRVGDSDNCSEIVRGGILKNSNSNNSLLRYHQKHQQQLKKESEEEEIHLNSKNHRPSRRLPPFLRSESRESTQRLTSPNCNDESDLPIVLTQTSVGGDRRSFPPQMSVDNYSPTSMSPTSVALTEFSFVRTESNGSTVKLKCLPEVDSVEKDCNSL